MYEKHIFMEYLKYNFSTFAVPAYIGQPATVTFGAACSADIASVQNEPVMGS